MKKSEWYLAFLAASMLSGVFILMAVVGDGTVDMAMSTIEIMLLIGLVVLTAIYVRKTGDLAEEAVRQRESDLLPIIDIKGRLSPSDLVEMGTDADRSEFARCIIKNLGRGPALNVRFDIVLPNGAKDGYSFAALPANNFMDSPNTVPQMDTGQSVEPRLQLKVHDKSDKQRFVRVEYSDVFGNQFTSVKLASDEKSGGELLGHLYFNRLPRRIAEGLAKGIIDPS